MKKRLLQVALLIGTLAANAQVGIGTSTPNKSAELTVVSKDKGLLIPNIALESTTDKKTITNGNVESLMVYNTNTKNNITPGYYYWYIDRWMRIVNHQDVSDLDTNTINTSLLVTGDELVLTDSDGNMVSIPLSEINIPTKVVKNPDGTYTHTNEEGIQITIDATNNVINNIENILGDTNVLNELIEVLDDTYVGGNVYYEGIDFTYIDTSGTEHIINFEQLVQTNETQTFLVDNQDGTYTYYNEAEIDQSGNPVVGTGITINIPGEFINNFETIVKEEVEVDGRTFNTFENYITYLTESTGGFTKIVYDQHGDVVFQMWNETTEQWEDVDNSKFNTIVQDNQKTVELEDGLNTLVSSRIDADNDKNTIWKVDVNNNINDVNADYVVAEADTVIMGNASASDINIALPVPSADNKGKRYIIKKADYNEDNYVNVSGNISGLNNSGAGLYTALPQSGWEFVSDGTNWRIINKF